MTILLLSTLTIFLLIITVDSYSCRSSLNIRRPAQAKSISRLSCSVFRGNSQKRVPLTVSAVNVPLAVSLPQAGGQNWWIWSLLASTSSLGIVLENTMIGAMLSSPLVTMGISLILCNLGVLPSSSPVYSTVLKVSRALTSDVSGHSAFLMVYIISAFRCSCHLRYLYFFLMLTFRSALRALELS